ncbi:MAG: M1 family metallopeptidase [Methanoregulaceae archaeon]
MTERLFRYYRKDFGKIPVRVIHMDLLFDVFDDHTRVTADLHAESRDSPLAELALNAKNLEILTVSCRETACSHTYDAPASMLVIRFGTPLPPRTQFTIQTETICRPTKNLLEGLYYDETPAGAPPQQITQCQQWGFQRLVPCIDDMTAKCTYTTTIIADARYTHLLTNGDISKPRQPSGNGRVTITYENRITPMAPYLFFLGCGTWAGFTRELEYPDGKQCTLELLVPLVADPVPAGQALDILADAVLWVHLFTGPGRYEGASIRERLYLLAKGLERLKKRNVTSPQLQKTRAELSTIIRQISPGYTYSGTVYREIAMQNSDFGGMENVGNTTITANRIMPHYGMTDPAYEYCARVKVHEFYHNLNGSEVTGESPFEIWLNEAVTVHIENQYHAFHAGEEYSRLGTVLTLLAPGSGTLDLDSGAASMPIEPEGFNDPNELITGITYVKAPEFVRMIETLMGKEAFAKGLDLYHRRYRYGNATRSQWIAAMEEVSGMQFSTMAEGWLKQTGFPTLSVKASYNRTRHVVTLHLRQDGDSPEKRWIFPVRIALADKSGNDITEALYRVEQKEEIIELDSPERPAFVSVNRGYSFYGKVSYHALAKELYLQARLDSDLVNRYIAFTTIMDLEKQRLLENPGADPDPDCMKLWLDQLSDRDLMMTAGGQFMTVPESVPDKRSTHRYRAVYEARQKLFRSIATAYKKELIAIYNSVDEPPVRRDSLHQEILDIKRRQIRNTALSVLSRLDTPDIHNMIKDQYDSASCATDRLVAFSLHLDSSAPDRVALFTTFLEESAKSPVSWENFLAAVAGNSSPEVLDFIARAEQSKTFRIDQSNDQRALYGRFALNRKLSLQTETGRAFLHRTLRELAKINEHSTVGMLQVFGALDAMESADQVPLVGILAALLEELKPDETPSVYNTIRRILAGAPDAVRIYEEQQGTIARIHP